MCGTFPRHTGAVATLGAKAAAAQPREMDVSEAAYYGKLWAISKVFSLVVAEVEDAAPDETSGPTVAADADCWAATLAMCGEVMAMSEPPSTMKAVNAEFVAVLDHLRRGAVLVGTAARTGDADINAQAVAEATEAATRAEALGVLLGAFAPAPDGTPTNG